MADRHAAIQFLCGVGTTGAIVLGFMCAGLAVAYALGVR